MNKNFGILILLVLSAPMSFAQVNMPSEPTYYKPTSYKHETVENKSSQYKKNNTANVQNPIKTSQPATKISNPVTSVNSVATALAKAELNGSDIEKYYLQLLDMGVENIQIQTIENGCPYRKGITPITVGGKTYTGNACTIVRYTYNGKSTGTGACN